MTAQEFVSNLQSDGFLFKAKCGKLSARGPRPLNQVERDQLRFLKPEILRLLYPKAMRTGVPASVDGRPCRIWQAYPYLYRVGVQFSDSDWPNFFDADEVELQGFLR